MDQAGVPHHLSEMPTLWSVVRRAHPPASQGPGEEAAAARGQLLEQYRHPAHRYLLAALRDANAAEELSQEFALRFLRGDFHRADPERGRFRAYVKTALFRLVAEHRRRARGSPGPLPDVLADEPPEGADADGSDAALMHSWREALLTRAWEGLVEVEERTGQPVHTVLRFRVDHPGLPSPQLAEQLSARLGRPLTATAARMALHRAREKFSDLLLGLVAQTLEAPTPDRLAEELVDLDLLEYCRPALDRLRSGEAP